MEPYRIFLKQYPVRRFARSEVIIQQDEIPKVAYIVKSGIIKTYNLTANGEEKPISFKLHDTVFPLGWVFSKVERAQYYYEALTDAALYLVPVEEYIHFLRSNPEVLFEVFKKFLDSSIEYQMRINALEQSRAKDKVLYTLQFLAYCFGKVSDDAFVEVQLPFTQQDMANFMGVARETAAIELKNLERRGIIYYQHKSYNIHTQKLQSLLSQNNDFKNEMPAFSSVLKSSAYADV